MIQAALRVRHSRSGSGRIGGRADAHHGGAADFPAAPPRACETWKSAVTSLETVNTYEGAYDVQTPVLGRDVTGLNAFE